MVTRTDHSRTTRVDIIGVPMDLGASRRGVDMGPSAIRYAKLHERLRELGIPEVLDHGNLAGADSRVGSMRMIALGEISRRDRERLRRAGAFRRGECAQRRPADRAWRRSFDCDGHACRPDARAFGAAGPRVDRRAFRYQQSARAHRAATCTACHCGLR